MSDGEQNTFDPLDALSQTDSPPVARWDSCPGPRCPDPDLIWRAARGQLKSEETKSLLSEVSQCQVCMTAWQSALEASSDFPPLAMLAKQSPRSRPTLVTKILGAAFGFGILALIALWFASRTAGPPAAQPLSWSDDTKAVKEMSREEFWLRWTGGASGKVVIKVYDSSGRAVGELEPMLNVVADTADGEVKIPVGAFDGIPALKSVIVTVSLPDQERSADFHQIKLID